MSEMEEDTPSLCDLPDDVICVLLRYLDATTLFLLSRTCTRLCEIIKSHITLWRHVDARRAPNSQAKTLYCLERCYDDTETLLLHGKGDPLVPNCFQKIGAFSKLSILAFENHTWDGSKYNVMAFPPQLHELSLKRTKVTNSLEFFKGSGEHFKKLRVLILDGCDWLTSSAFMPISKYSSLEIVSVYKCRNLENSIAYLSLSGQGFKALKVFDARLSPLGNIFIRAIYRIQSLLAIYLQNEDVTYKLDYFKRKLEIEKGGPTRDFFDGDNEFDLKESQSSIEERGLSCEDGGNLDDEGLIDYWTVHSESKVGELPQSVLYLDPYNSCTCGFEENRKKHKNGSSLLESTNSDGDDDDDSDDLDQNDSKARLLSQKISHLNNLIRQSQTNVNYRRSLLHSFRHPTPVVNNNSSLRNYINTVICMNLDRSGNSRPDHDGVELMRVLVFRDHVPPDGDEPPAKRLKTDEPVAGPSGMNRSNEAESGSDSDGEEPLSARRPPTPHPDVTFNNPERGASYRIYFRNSPSPSPIVQIENVNDTHKDLKVSLRRLSLRGYKKITNAALNYIKDLDLDLLDLTYTGVTVEAIEDYLKSHPLCRVVHERFCTCPPNIHF